MQDDVRAAADSDALVYFGDAVKALGSGRIGGIVVPFATAEAPDSQNEFFTPNTDLGLDVSARVRVVYHHGFTKAYGRRKFGVADLAPGDGGVHGDATLDTADAAGRAFYERAERGELFWSSGSASHLVERRPVKGAVEIVAWPIIEVSLTPTPVDRRARAYPLKSLLDDEGAVAAPSLVDRSERLVADARELVALFDRAVKAREAEGRSLSPAKRAALKSLRDEIGALASACEPGPDPERLRALRLRLLQARL